MKVLDLHSQVRSQIMKLSVVMPIYNERNTLRSVIERVLSVPLEIEMLCVDDGSGDGSREILADLQTEHPNLRTFLQPCNMGKGAALGVGYRKLPVISWSFRTRISNTIRRTIPHCLTLSYRAKLMWFMGRVSWAADPIACCTSVTR